MYIEMFVILVVRSDVVDISEVLRIPDNLSNLQMKRLQHFKGVEAISLATLELIRFKPCDESYECLYDNYYIQ